MILDQIKIIEIMIFDLIWSVSDQIFQYSAKNESKQIFAEIFLLKATVVHCRLESPLKKYNSLTYDIGKKYAAKSFEKIYSLCIFFLHKSCGTKMWVLFFLRQSRKGSRKYHTAYYIQYIEEGKCNFHFPTKAGSSTFFIGKKWWKNECDIPNIFFKPIENSILKC